MGVFCVLFFVPILMQHFVVNKSHVVYEKKNENALFFYFLFFAVLVALRHENIGNDTQNYIHFFQLFSKTNWSGLGKVSLEYGFSYFNKIISLFTDEPQVFLAVTAMITVAMIYPTYKRLCVDASLTIVLFGVMPTFVMMFSGIRQMLAIGIGFIAYECTRRKKLIPFILCVVLAISFHISAFMIAFMYPLYHAKITKKWLIAVVPVFAFVFVFNEKIFFALGLLLERFTEYDASIEQTGAYTMLILFVIFAVFAFLIPDETMLDAETIGLRNFLLFSVAVQMFASLHATAMRMNYYYIIFIPLLLPKIIEYRSTRWEQIARVGRHVMVIFFLMYFFLNAYDGGGGLNVFPYSFFWEGA